MHFAFRPKLSYSNVIATIALFVALGGAAIAAGLPRHSVGARQLKRGAVTTRALRRGAVTSAKLAQGSVVAGKLGSSAVSQGTIADGAVTSGAIASGAVNAGKLGSNAVTTGKIANGAITTAKLGSEVAPLLGALRSGQTLRGVFEPRHESPGSRRLRQRRSQLSLSAVQHADDDLSAGAQRLERRLSRYRRRPDSQCRPQQPLRLHLFAQRRSELARNRTHVPARLRPEGGPQEATRAPTASPASGR